MRIVIGLIAHNCRFINLEGFTEREKKPLPVRQTIHISFHFVLLEFIAPRRQTNG